MICGLVLTGVFFCSLSELGVAIDYVDYSLYDEGQELLSESDLEFYPKDAGLFRRKAKQPCTPDLQINGTVSNGTLSQPIHCPFVPQKSNPDDAHYILGVLKENIDKCLNGPVDIKITESAVDPKKYHYFMAIGGDHFVEATHANRFYPLVQLDNFPEWAKFKAAVQPTAQTVYTFKEKAVFRKGQYIGFQQLLLGCPQSLCTSNRVDAVYFRYKRNSLHALVGYHEWDLKTASPEISTRNPPIVRLSPNTALTLSSSTGGYIVMVKERFFIIVEEMKDISSPPAPYGYTLIEIISGAIEPRRDEVYSPFPSKFPQDVDAMVVQAIPPKLSEGFIYVFKGDKFWKYPFEYKKIHKSFMTLFFVKPQTGGYPKDTKSLNPSLEGVDEIYIDNEKGLPAKFHMFRGGFYATGSLDGWFDEKIGAIKIDWKYSHETIFKCNLDKYKDWGLGSWDAFKKKYLSKTTTDGPIPTNVPPTYPTEPTDPTAVTETSKNPPIIGDSSTTSSSTKPGEPSDFKVWLWVILMLLILCALFTSLAFLCLKKTSDRSKSDTGPGTGPASTAAVPAKGSVTKPATGSVPTDTKPNAEPAQFRGRSDLSI